MAGEGKVSEKDVDATVASLDQALKLTGLPLPLKELTGVVRMVLRHTTSQGQLEAEYAKLDDEHRVIRIGELVSEALREHLDPLAAAAVEQLDASERVDVRLDQIVTLLYQIISSLTSERKGGQHVENRGATIGTQFNIYMPSPGTSNETQRETRFEGPGGLPITAVSNFLGRTDELEQLEQALVQHTTVCVVATGIGGIGKTSLARQFVFERGATRFPDGSAWVDATRLDQDLDRVCRRFGWADERQPGPAEAIAWLARALHEQRFLLVVDNVSAELERDHIPRPGGRCRTLVTSRERNLHDDLDAERVEVGVLGVRESLELLRARCPRLRGHSDAELEPLVEFVGWLPLGLKLLVSFLLKRTSLGPVAALAALRTQPVAVLEKYRGQNPGLLATFQSTYDDLDEPERRVLQAMAVCARQTRDEVVRAVSGVENADEVLDDLHGCSLVERDTGAKAPWKLHDVVRMFVTSQAGLEGYEAAHLKWVDRQMEAHSRELAYVELGEVIDEAAGALGRLVTTKELELAMRFYRPIEYHLRRVGASSRALTLSEKLLAAMSPESVWVAECLNRIGICYQIQGDLERAILSHERGLAIDERAERLEGQANQLGNLGLCYRTQGDIEKAILYHKRGLAIDERVGRLEGQAASLGNLGLCYRTQGDIAMAIEYHKRALAIHEKVGKLEGQANQLGNLGLCYRTQGDVEKAISYHERALAIHEKVGKLEGQAANLGNLGLCYMEQGDLTKAIAYQQRALALNDEVGLLEGQAIQLGNLGECYRKQGNNAEAIKCIERALVLYRRMGFSEAHPDVAHILNVRSEMGAPDQ